MTTKMTSLGKKCLSFLFGILFLISISITTMAAGTAGDINGDDTVSAPDLATLRIVLLQGVDDIQCDINGDGEIDIRDLVRLKKKIAQATITVSAPVEAVDGKVPAGGVTLAGGGVSAFVPEGVLLENGVDELVLTVTPLLSLSGDLAIDKGETINPYDIHISGISKANTKAIIIDLGVVMPKYLNMGNYRVYHIENGENKLMTFVEDKAELNAHNQFTYDPSTGAVSIAMASFSEVALVSVDDNTWNGEYDYSWYNASKTELTIANADQLAAFGQIVGGMAEGKERDSFEGKTVTLVCDIDLGDAENAKENLIFHPIGYYYTDDKNADGTTGDYYSTVYSFEGIFNGDGHKIANFYQNTWEIKGDYDAGYYKDAMGLFGYVVNGTVKNLTVDNFSSDGEYTPTGVIAAYAVNSNFENIAITNCNPRVYNTGNGGIVGVAGRESDVIEALTFKNITVDKTNKISALWGSWDVACGGLVGMYRGNADANGEHTGDTISFDNCHVAAQIDVYNDVCANYQYYAYRYAGMIIGSIRHNTKDEQGNIIPNMAGVSASDCTVNYGDWNDYYYCEFEENSMASYSEDYQFSRVPNSEIDTTNGKENATCIGHNHTAAEDKQAVYLPFHQLFTGYSWGVNSIGLEELDGIKNITVEISDINKSVEKFEAKFTGDFLYRVGNLNSVTLGSLFEAKSGAKINNSGVVVTIDKIDENTDVSGKFTADTADWSNGTILFSGTGVVKVTIQDYDYCEPTVLYLEVVDAINATSATNATSNNVVLLNDCGFSSLEVSNGFALYGNGFTMTCASDSYALDFGYSFVTLDSGVLDNIQIVCPNFDYAALYKSNLTSSENRSYTDNAGKTRYYNAKSGVMVSGNSQILNSRISGARAAVNITSGNVVIDNSRIELGAVASVLIGSANSVTLRDVTLIQQPTVSTHDSTKSLMGFSVLIICNSEGDAAPVNIEGELIQNAWVDESDSKYVPSAGKSIITNVLSNADYTHDLDGDGIKESLNLGFAYMPESANSEVNNTTITDNRSNKLNIPYDYATVSTGGVNTFVYSYKYAENENTPAEFINTFEYVPNKFSDIITVSYSDTTDGLTTGKSYDTQGWVYELNVDLDKISGYAIDFNKLSLKINGVTVNDFKVNGSAKPENPVAVAEGGTLYTITATIKEKEYTAFFKVIGTETSKESPSLVAKNYNAALLVGEAGNALSKDTWHGAAPVLNGIQIRYWSVAEKQYKTITLSDYTPTTAGKQNGTNAEWTYSPDNGDFTLTIKNETAVHSGNSVYAMPVVFNSKLYFVANGSKGLVNYGNDARSIKINYYFKDNNGGEELKFEYTWSIECPDKATCYDYSDFCNGTSKTFTIKSSNGSGCVTPDTLVTMADGSKKEIKDVKVGENVVAWNFHTGKYEIVPVILLQAHSTGEMNVLHLYFEDGTELKVIGEHGIFDADLNTFIFIDEFDVENYVGHDFIKQDGDGFKTVKLISFNVVNEDTTAYTILSYWHYNVLLEDMFTVTPAHIGDNFFNPFDIGEDMMYDQEAVEADIEKFGLYTYEDFDHVLTREQFDALNIAQFKVSVGKGYVTYDGLIYLIETFINGDF